MISALRAPLQTPLPPAVQPAAAAPPRAESPAQAPAASPPAPAPASAPPARGTALETQGFVAEPVVPVSTEAHLQIFPASWQRPDFQTRVSAVHPSQEAAALQSLTRGQEKYPAALLAENVSQAHVVGSLSFFDTPYGGTNSKDKVYVVADGHNHVEKTFHHEVSSILLRKHSELLDKEAWNKLLPKGFSYGSDIVQAFREGATGMRSEAKHLRNGFVAEYSRSSLENDFNMIAENLFAGEASFWQAVDRYPKLRSKAELVMQFYQQLSPELTPAYFRQLQQAVNTP